MTREFYQHYLQALANYDPASADRSPIADHSALVNRFVASDTSSRIAEIHAIYEQEILEADYFTSCQDYTLEWVKRLQVGNARLDAAGAAVPVSIGVENGNQLHLMVYLKQENNVWKIYRVRDITHHYEAAIFNDKAIRDAKAHARKVLP
ncbi:DUF3828 domain-containing protein [Pseudenterobacter timonensis]|uniref:DUF3828 domain-containing protein n=1 Tax=Pseudenterobacter timonensis TaxID=1755099 RepID=A0ABV4AA10_9ENTR